MNDENYIVFDQYLEDELTPDERSNFENQLSENQELALAFQNFKEVQAQLENRFGLETERKAYKENLKIISDSHFSNKNAKVITLKPWMYMAAASVVLLLGIFLFNPSSNPNFDEYNQFEAAHFVERGDQADYLKQAENAYNSKDYQKAVPLFESILKEKKTAEIQYFYGVSLLESNKIQESELVFHELQSGNSIYKNKAIWGLALAKLKQKDYKACKEILMTIPVDYESYDDVQRLLKDLD